MGLSKLPRCKRKKNQGVTLLELIVVLAIFGIMTAVAVPYLRPTTEQAELRAAAQELYGYFQRAKVEAAKKNLPVAIIFTLSGTNKYTVFVDSNNDKILDSGEQVIADISLRPQQIFASSTFPGGGAETGFTPNGLPSGGAGTIVIKDINTGASFALSTSVAGNISLE
ncbi:GspH/FimT family pseudopilin [Pelobacter seleniigenes]|uniref:GspH/FimT family pseudopilin n=1 Tax=Pelobacter seleniigenes TaxID=407188 RepID=UPI0004A6B140|nr:GspH/FimT family pseudopilin [Pelobacter seleniigenes]